ncbi:rRNA-processing protein UTP23 homolog [Linum perenne]
MRSRGAQKAWPFLFSRYRSCSKAYYCKVFDPFGFLEAKSISLHVILTCMNIKGAHWEFNFHHGRCDHEGIKSAEACITDIVGENNPEHFFIATQDAELRNKFQEVPGVPLIFGLRNALFLEKPSAFQHEFVKDRERDMLKKETGKILQTAESGTSAVEHEGPGDDCFARWDLQSKRYVRNGLDVKDKPKFKRKKAKGPNPLSCQKKKSANPKASVAKKHGS